MMRKLGAIPVLALVLITLTGYPGLAQSPTENDVLGESLSILKRLQTLESRHINVTPLVEELNTAVQLAQNGDAGSAEKMIRDVESKVARLEAGSETHYRVYMAVKTAEVAVLLSAPLLFYFGFPRLYLYIWFRVRRRWIVKNGSARR